MTLTGERHLPEYAHPDDACRSSEQSTRHSEVGSGKLMRNARCWHVRVNRKISPDAGVARKHGATRVRLIGSVSRGEARPDSDVDLLVTWSQGSSLLNQAALMLELEGLLGRKVDIASDGWVKPSIRESVYRDAIAL